MRKRYSQASIALAVLLFGAAAIAGIAETTEQMKEKWGVEIEGVRLSAAGYMLDFRYRVTDPEKAMPVMDPRVKPYIIDEASGAKFIVPTPPKVGSLRQTARHVKPVPNKTYFVMFANPGRHVKPGGKVTVVIGEFRAENLSVQ